MKTYACASISWLALAIAAHAQSFPGNPSANQIYAGPANGPAAPAQFRSMVTGDIPAGTVVNSNLANMAAGTVKCQPAGGNAGAPKDCSYPSVNVVDYGASGSTTSTTGTISASSSSLSLASAIDFKNGQGIRINGAGATFATNPPSGLTVTQNGTTGATTYQYQVASLDCAGGVGAAITTVSISNGNATLSQTNSITVSWTAPASGPGPCGYAVYGKTASSMTLLQIVRGSTRWNDVGTTTVPSPDWLPSAPQGAALNDYLLTTIASGAGTASLTLSAAASNAVSGTTVAHDDTNAIQNAINSLPAAGGVVYFPPGNYQTTSTINIGNGSGNTSSTTNGIALVGLASRGGVAGLAGSPNFFAANIHCLWYGAAIVVNGPIAGWEIDHLSIDFTGVGSTNSFGLLAHSAGFGNVNGLFVSSSYFYGVLDQCQVTGGFSPCQVNSWNDIQVFMPTNAPSANGIGINGTSFAGMFAETWNNVQVIPSTLNQLCLNLGAMDTAQIRRFSCNPSGVGAVTAILFDYTINSSWPSNVNFYDVDIYGNSIANNGSPSTVGHNENRIFDFSRVNGGATFTLPNLLFMDWMTGGATPTLSAGCSGAGSSVTGNNYHGTITGQTAAATTCTLSFAAPTFQSSPDCQAIGYSSPLTGSVIVSGTSSLQVSFASTANYKWSYSCQGP
jgi:hypothetical protein